MAVYNEIGIGRWNRFIQKITDIKGSPPARQLASEIVFQHPIFHGNENRYLESWDRFAMATTTFAVVGQPSGARLNNPSGSNVIAVLEKAVVHPSAASAVELQYGTPGADLNVALVAIPLETRGRSASTLRSSTNSAVGAILNSIVRIGSITTPFEFLVTDIHEIAIPPGAAVQVQISTVNIQSAVSFFWRERFLEPAERF